MSVALTLEDGTGVTGANTYVAQADAITYWTNWGYTSATTATSQNQINALYYAAYSLDRLYGRRYISVIPPASAQGLLWPRYTIMGHDFRLYDQGTIPQALMDAQCEMANMFITGIDLYPDENDKRLHKIELNRIGGIIQTNTFWQIPTDVERYVNFRKIDLILWPLLEQENNDGARLTL